MKRAFVVTVVVVLAVAFVVVQLTRTVPGVSVGAARFPTAMPGSENSMSWPSEGEAAIGVEGSGLLATHGTQTPTPLASITKLMTAYIVLHDHPLALGASGPTLTVSPQDVATYQADRAQGDSVVAVKAGEHLSELQALEGVLVPSGDNMANLLAVWDAGNEQAFVAKMNATAKQLGLTSTHYADASGVAAGSTSSASSQARLAMADMAFPMFRYIVDLPQVTLPVAGVTYNVDSQLGHHGIVGIKTGWTSWAGGCFVFAVNTRIGTHTRTLVGVVLGQFATKAQPSPLAVAFDTSTAILTTAERALEQATVVQRGETLGRLRAPWGGPVALQSSRSVTLIGLRGQRIHTTVELPSTVKAPIAAGRRVGSLIVRLGYQRVTVPLRSSQTVPAAPLGWRLSHF